MFKVVIVGGGFSGLWSAFSAVRMLKKLEKSSEVKITLINKDPYHGIRPRFYENTLEETRVLLSDFLEPLSVSLVHGEVLNIDYQSQELHINEGEILQYDKLILATGSHLVSPNIIGAKEYAFNVDSYAAAIALQSHINALPNDSSEGRYTVVVVGGGFTGIEAATDFMDRLRSIAPKDTTPKVIVLDRTRVAGHFSQEMQQVMFEALEDMGIETMSNVKIKKIHKDHIILSNDDVIKTSTVVWTAGMQSNELTKQFDLTLDRFGRLPVDRFLRIQGIKNCYAAGDVAAATTDGEHDALLSCQHAMPQGRFAGNNVIAELFGEEPLMYEQPKFVTCIDLGSWGSVYSEGWDQKVIKTKEAAKKIKLFINHERIYPPSVANGINKLLEAAEPAFKPIKL